MISELLTIAGFVGLVAAVIFGGGWLIARKNSILSDADPVEHFEVDP